MAVAKSVNDEYGIRPVRQIHLVGRSTASSGFHHDWTAPSLEIAKLESSRSQILANESELPLRALLRAQEDMHNKWSRPPLQYDTAPYVWASGANNEPLGSITRKRHASTSDENLKSSKVPRLNDVTTTSVAMVHHATMIDYRGSNNGNCGIRNCASVNTNNNCTQSSNSTRMIKSSKADTSHRYSHDSRSFDLVGAVSRRSRKRANRGAAAQLTNLIDGATIKAFTKVKKSLAVSERSITAARETLSMRWNTDPKLKQPQAMKHLNELGSCLIEVEDGLAKALTIMGKLF
ncbi:hypothetical protein MMC19_002803 [Ptychographa xylographoides]|nr:hypothetical protein [Ptychographa xylographoides]